MYTFREVFGFDFGEQRNVTKYPDDNANVVEVEFTTPAHSEEDVRFSISTMAYVMDKTISLQILFGGHVLYSDNRSISVFVNDTGVDPKPPKVRDDTHNGEEYEVPRETHLLPNTTYIYRITSRSTPVPISYYGTDTGNETLYGIEMSHEGVDGIWFPKD